MKDTKFPPIDDILANNIEPEPAITTPEKEQQIATPAKEANPETVTQMLKRRAALQPKRFTQSDPKIAIDRVIIDTINLCDFGHLTAGAGNKRHAGGFHRDTPGRIERTQS